METHAGNFSKKAIYHFYAVKLALQLILKLRLTGLIYDVRGNQLNTCSDLALS